MYYTTASAVINTLPVGVSVGTNTRPMNATDVGLLVIGIEAELNAAAAQAGYGVPISTLATGAFGLMALHARERTQAGVLDAFLPNIGGPGAGANVASRYRSSYEDFVRQLRQGKLPLPGASADPGGSSRELARSNVTSLGVASPRLSIAQEF